MAGENEKIDFEASSDSTGTVKEGEVETVVDKAKPAMSGDLLSEIQKGIKLKKVSEMKSSEKPKEAEKIILQSALKQHRKDMGYEDDNEEDFDIEEASVEEIKKHYNELDETEKGEFLKEVKGALEDYEGDKEWKKELKNWVKGLEKSLADKSKEGMNRAEETEKDAKNIADNTTSKGEVENKATTKVLPKDLQDEIKSFNFKKVTNNEQTLSSKVPPAPPPPPGGVVNMNEAAPIKANADVSNKAAEKAQGPARGDLLSEIQKGVKLRHVESELAEKPKAAEKNDLQSAPAAQPQPAAKKAPPQPAAENEPPPPQVKSNVPPPQPAADKSTPNVLQKGLQDEIKSFNFKKVTNNEQTLSSKVPPAPPQPTVSVAGKQQAESSTLSFEQQLSNLEIDFSTSSDVDSDKLKKGAADLVTSVSQLGDLLNDKNSNKHSDKLSKEEKIGRVEFERRKQMIKDAGNEVNGLSHTNSDKLSEKEKIGQAEFNKRKQKIEDAFRVNGASRTASRTKEKDKQSQINQIVKYNNSPEEAIDKGVLLPFDDGDKQIVKRKDMNKGVLSPFGNGDKQIEGKDMNKGVLLPFDDGDKQIVKRKDMDKGVLSPFGNGDKQIEGNDMNKGVLSIFGNGDKQTTKEYDNGVNLLTYDENTRGLLEYQQVIEPNLTHSPFPEFGAGVDDIYQDIEDDDDLHPASRDADENKIYEEIKSKDEKIGSKDEKKESKNEKSETYLQKKCKREKFKVDKQREGLKLAALFKDALGERLEGVKGINVMYSSGKFKVQLDTGNKGNLETYELSEAEAYKILNGNERDKEAIYEKIRGLVPKQGAKMQMKNFVNANGENYDEVQDNLKLYSNGLNYMYNKLENVTQRRELLGFINKTYIDDTRLEVALKDNPEELSKMQYIVKLARNIGHKWYDISAIGNEKSIIEAFGKEKLGEDSPIIEVFESRNRNNNYDGLSNSRGVDEITGPTEVGDEVKISILKKLASNTSLNSLPSNNKTNEHNKQLENTKNVPSGVKPGEMGNKSKSKDGIGLE